MTKNLQTAQLFRDRFIAQRWRKQIAKDSFFARMIEYFTTDYLLMLSINTLIERVMDRYKSMLAHHYILQLTDDYFKPMTETEHRSALHMAFIGTEEMRQYHFEFEMMIAYERLRAKKRREYGFDRIVKKLSTYANDDHYYADGKKLVNFLSRRKFEMNMERNFPHFDGALMLADTLYFTNKFHYDFTAKILKRIVYHRAFEEIRYNNYHDDHFWQFGGYMQAFSHNLEMLPYLNKGRLPRELNVKILSYIDEYIDCKSTHYTSVDDLRLLPWLCQGSKIVTVTATISPTPTTEALTPTPLTLSPIPLTPPPNNRERHQALCMKEQRRIARLRRVKEEHKVPKSCWSRVQKKLKMRLRAVARKLKNLDFQSQAGILDNILPKFGLDEQTSNLVSQLTSTLEQSVASVRDGIDINLQAPQISRCFDSIRDITPSKRALIEIIIAIILNYVNYVNSSPIIEAMTTIYQLYLMYKYWDRCGDELQIISIANLIGILYRKLRTRKQEEKVVVSAGHEFRKQSSEIELEGVGSNLVNSILAWMYYQAFGKVDSSNVVESFLKEIKGIKNVASDAKFTVEWFLNIIAMFGNFLAKNFGLDGLKTNTEVFPELKELQQEVADCVRGFQKGEVDYCYDSSIKVFEIVDKLDLLDRKIPNSNAFTVYKTALLRLKSAIRPITVCLLSNNVVRNGPRNATFGVAFGGRTDTGKTTAQPCIMTDILLRVLDEDRRRSFMNNKNDHFCYYDKNDPYMSNYHGQTVFFIDEYGQTLDAPGAINPEFPITFSACSNNNVNISGAAVEDKGRKNFTSELMNITTNITNFDCLRGTVRDPSALARRFVIQIWQCVKPEYATDETLALGNFEFYRLDKTKAANAPRVNASDTMSLDVYDFYKYNFMAKNSTERFVDKNPLSYNELVEWISIEFLKHKQNQRDFIKYVYAMDKHSTMESEKFRKKYADAHGDLIFKAQAGIKEIDDFEEDQLLTGPRIEYLDMPNFSEMCFRFKYMATTLGLDPEKTFSWLWNSSEKVWKLFLRSFENIHINKHILTYYTSTILAPIAIESLNLIEAVKSFICENKFLVAVASAVSLGSLCWFWFKEKFVPQGGLSEYSHKSGKTHRTARSTKTFLSKDSRNRYQHSSTFKSQASRFTQNHQNVMDSIFNNNMYQWTIDGITKPIAGVFLFLEGRVAISPHHYKNVMESAQEHLGYPPTIKFWNVSSPESTFQLRFDDLESVVSRDTYQEDNSVVGDRCYWKFPKAVCEHRSIIKFLPKSDYALMQKKFYGALLKPSLKPVDRSFGVYSMDCVPISNFTYEDVRGNFGFHYPIYTVEGDCGAVLFTADDRDTEIKIVGIHCAGNSRLGYATALDVDEAIDALSYYNTVSCGDITEELHDEDKVVEKLIAEFQALDSKKQSAPLNLRPMECIRTKSLRVPTKSKLKKTLFFDTYAKHTKEPAKLVPFVKDGEVINPWALAQKKLCPPREYMREHVLFEIVSKYQEKLYRNTPRDPTYKPRILTLEEAIAGIPGKLRGMPRKTSAGWPWCTFLKNGKKQIFGQDEEYDFTTPHFLLFKAEVDKLLATYKAGKRPTLFFVGWLKDELRTIEKSQNGNTRGFNGAPAHFIAVERMYMGSFIMWMQDNRIYNGSCVGINPHGPEWTMMVKSLLQVGNNMFDGDVGNFDGSIAPQVMYASADIVEGHYYNATPEDTRVRELIFEDIIWSRHIGHKYEAIIDENERLRIIHEDITFQYNGNQPSGNFATADLNSIFNIILIMYCCYLILEKYAPELLPELFTVEVRVFGDDSIVAVTDRLTIINQQTMQEAMSSIGIKYTAADKSSEFYKHKPITGVTFLKRSFRYDEECGQWLAPIALETIYEAPMWTRDGAPPESVMDTFRTSLRELSYYGRKTFDELSKPMVRACIEHYGECPAESNFDIAFAAARGIETEW